MKVMMKKSTTPTGRDSDKFMLRLPDGMRDAISERAKASGRSMNAEIIYRLQRTFDEDEVIASQAPDMVFRGDVHTLPLGTILTPRLPGYDDRRYTDSELTKEVREILEYVRREMKNKNKG